MCKENPGLLDEEDKNKQYCIQRKMKNVSEESVQPGRAGSEPEAADGDGTAGKADQ